MSFAEVEKFYGQLAKKNAIGEALGKRIRSISSEPELQKFIQEEILPLARKMGYDFSEKDLLEYEKMVAQKLSPEDLLNVTGGFSLRSALLSGGIFSLAMLGFGSIAPMQADAMVPKAVVESVTGDVVVDVKEDAVISVGQQINGAIKAELKGKVSLQEVIQPLMRIIAVQNTTAEQKESAVKLLLNLVSEDKKEDLRASIENIKSTLPADVNLTEEDVKEFLSKTNEMLENIAQAPQSAGFAADQEKVIPATEKVAEEAKDGNEIEISQTDYGYILDAWNGAEALVYKLTGLAENFRFLNPANHPTLEKKDGEKYFRWKYNEDSGDGFGELMRILFPCSDGERIVTDGGAPNVPAFSRDCKPTVKLMAQIAAMLYKYRTAMPEEKKVLAQEIKDVLSVVDKLVKENKFDVKTIGDSEIQELETQLIECVRAVKDCATDFKEAITQKETSIAAKKLKKSAADSEVKADVEKVTQGKLARLTNISNAPQEWTEDDFKHIKYILDSAAAYTNEKKEKPLKITVDSIVKPFGKTAGLVDSYSKYVKLKNRELLNKFCNENFEGTFTKSTGTAFSSMDNLHKANTLLHVLHSAFYAIDNQEYDDEDYNDAAPNKFAPKYFVEKMLMNFCIEHFNSADELNGFYNEAKSLIKHNPTTASLTQAKESGERIENTLKLLKKLEVSKLSPYKSGTAQNGDTYKIGPVENGNVTFINDTFADCADIAVRHVVNLLGYSVNKNWNVFFDGLLDQEGNFTEEEKTKLEARLEAFKAAADGHTQFEFLPLKDRLQLFFYHQSNVGVDATDEITRTLWEYAICNMNESSESMQKPDKKNPSMDKDGYYYIRYKQGNYELKSGHINSLKLVYNIAKALGLRTDGLDDAKAAIDALEAKTREEDPEDLEKAFNEAVQRTYSLINPDASIGTCTVGIQTYKINEKTFKDAFGKVDIDIEIDDDRSDFVVNISTGHSYIEHAPIKPPEFNADELNSDADRILAKKTADEYSDIAKKTQLNRFHMLFGNFLSRSASEKWRPGNFTEKDSQYYKDFQALRFLKAAQGEEENEDRLKDELKNNPFVRDANMKINLREVHEKKTTTKGTPLALFAYENYCPDKFKFFPKEGSQTKWIGLTKETKIFQKQEIAFLTSFEEYKKEEANEFTYMINDGKATLALYKGNDTEIKIAEKVDDCPVTKIGRYCFYQGPKERTIEKVTIPSTVEEIGEKAFNDCSNLNTVEFAPNSQLKILGKHAFSDCKKLSKVVIPKSVERIEAWAFGLCSKLENIAFEMREKPISIEPSAFIGCPFCNITFPHNVEFGKDSLSNAVNLKTLTFTGPGEIKKENILKFLPYDVAGNFFKHNIEKLFDAQDSMQIDNKLTIDLWGGYLSEDGTLDLSSFDIETFKTFKLARNKCVKRVIWPQGIDEIPERMFSECDSLEEVTIPNTVNEVGRNAFYGCTNLAKVAFEAGRKETLSIGSTIFDSSYKITEVTIPNKISLDSGAFGSAKIEKIIIDADADNLKFGRKCFGYNVIENLRVYVKNEDMKAKLTSNKGPTNINLGNVIVGLPQGNE